MKWHYFSWNVSLSDSQKVVGSSRISLGHQQTHSRQSPESGSFPVQGWLSHHGVEMRWFSTDRNHPSAVLSSLSTLPPRVGPTRNASISKSWCAQASHQDKVTTKKGNCCSIHYLILVLHEYYQNVLWRRKYDVCVATPTMRYYYHSRLKLIWRCSVTNPQGN